MATKTRKAKAAALAAKPKKPVPLEKQFKKAPVVNIQADYNFSDPEKQKLGNDLAGLTQKREEIALHKKEVNAQLSAQAEEVNAQIKRFANMLRSGFETRATEALVIFNAGQGKKSYYRKSDHSFIREEPMLPSDYEQELPMPGLPTSQKPPAAEPKPGKKGSKKTKGSPVGETSFADALDKAAAGKPLPRVPIILDPAGDAVHINRAFRTAAKKVGWPDAAIKLLKKETDKVDTTGKMVDIYSAHTTPEGALAK